MRKRFNFGLFHPVFLVKSLEQLTLIKTEFVSHIIQVTRHRNTPYFVISKASNSAKYIVNFDFLSQKCRFWRFQLLRSFHHVTFFPKYFIKIGHKNSEINWNLFVKEEQILTVFIISAIAKGKLMQWNHSCRTVGSCG